MIWIHPITVKAARRIVKQWHRHLPKIQGGLFAAAAAEEDFGDPRIVGVAIAANPPRVWNGMGRIVIARVATDGTRNSCSMLYGAMCRASAALGYLEAWTYTLPEESGESLRGAGFEEMGINDGGEWNSKSRPRAPAARSDPKLRWRRILAPTRPLVALEVKDESPQMLLDGI